MFCKNCGKQIDDKAAVCIYCGISTGNNNSSLNGIDNPSHLPGVAGCCFPLVGIILYFMWKDEKPKSASLVIKWTLAGIAIGFIGSIIYIIFIILLGALSYY